MALNIQTRNERIPSRDGGTIEIGVVECSGRIVYGEESFMCRDTVKLLLGEVNRVVINLAQVPYIDSGGIGTLLGLFTSARNAGGDMKLACLSRRVEDLLRVTRLATVFESFPTEQEALASFVTRDAAASA